MDGIEVPSPRLSHVPAFEGGGQPPLMANSAVILDLGSVHGGNGEPEAAVALDRTVEVCVSCCVVNPAPLPNHTVE